MSKRHDHAVADSQAARAPDMGDPRPVVRVSDGSNRSLWIFGIVLLLGGFMLFRTLSAGRVEQISSTLPTVTDGGVIAAPPPLSLPPGADPYATEAALFARLRMLEEQAATAAGPNQAPPAPTERIVERIVSVAAPASDNSAVTPAPFIAPPRPMVVSGTANGTPGLAAPQPGNNNGADRVTAGRLLNPALTVPQGTVVAAVLETALDSTRPGGVRAIVSRDVMGFDGSRVLIPRGSRLYGEYQADMAPGQKRALIRWQRLTRPDAVTIDLDSPAADPLGRAGVGGRVNTHFFTRFGNAIMQSVLDLGVGLATRAATDGVIVALPGSTQNVTGSQNTQIQPTLKVQQGASVSVFVARDLDFSTVDR